MSAKVRLLVRILRPNGCWTYAPAVYTTNRRLRACYALVAGTAQHHPEAVYYLRFNAHGKRVWKNVGSDPVAALNELAVEVHRANGLALGIVSAEPVATPRKAAAISEPAPAEEPARLRWDTSVHDYMLEIESRKSSRTAILYQQALDEFAAASPVTYLDEITRAHLLALDAHVRNKGNSARTAYGHMVSVGTFLRYHGFADILRKNDLPRYTKKVAEAYSAEELQKLFAAAHSEDRLLFEFFLGTGFRDQEVMHASPRDVDCRSGLVHVRAKPAFNWQPKDREERSVPISDDLADKLNAHIKANPTQRLLFGTQDGKPDYHMLRRLKQTALRAGLNCGECVSEGGDRCNEHAVCKRWILHTFRRTFATMHHESGGVSIRTLADWLGHADVSTTWRYIAIADKRSAATRRAVNNSFLGLAS